MTSLPQGWHGVSGIARRSSSGAASSVVPVPTTIRKKWNSPQLCDVPRSKLPSYRRASATSLQNDPMSTNLTEGSPAKAPTTPQRKAAIPSKVSVTKEYQTEITNLRKEITTLKAENSILKAKVRRVDEENSQKSRQIEKMRSEIKTLQTADLVSSKKSKESESVLVLRQKCLRLEGALKEKDNALKKLNQEIRSMKMEESAKYVDTFQKEGGKDGALKDSNASANKPSGKNPVRSSLSRASISSKSEVTRLRDMLHKLQDENKGLQQQVKEKDLEIRRLKMQFQRQGSRDVRSASSIHSNKASKENKNPLTNVTTLADTKTKSTSVQSQKIILKNTRKPLEKPALSVNNCVPNKTPSIPRNSTLNKGPRAALSKDTKTVLPNGTVKRIVPKKQTFTISSKTPISQAGSTFIISKSIQTKGALSKTELKVTSALDKTDMEAQLENIKQNVAARTIQRSWRSHQKRLSDNYDLSGEKQALAFISTSLKHHKLRKEKLNLLVKGKKDLKLMDDEESAIVSAIQAATKKLWEKEMSTTY